MIISLIEFSDIFEFMIQECFINFFLASAPKIIVYMLIFLISIYHAYECSDMASKIIMTCGTKNSISSQ